MLPSEKEKSGGGVSFRQGTVQAIRNESSLADNHLQVNYTTFNVICTGWNICNSWAAVGGKLAIGITQGGSVTVLYGIILVFVCLGSCAATLAEFASVYPTSGGQYHYTSNLSPKRLARGLSYCCGALNVFSWIVICGSACLQPAQCILGMVSYWDPDYVEKPWHYFLVYQASNVLVMAYSMNLARRSNWIHNVGCMVIYGPCHHQNSHCMVVLSIGAFLNFTIVCLARSDYKQESSFVWTTFLNETGWKSHGVVFLTGLINPTYIFAGLDGTIHLAEECTNPRATVPKALLSTICIGIILAFTFAVSMLYSLSDFTAVLETRTGWGIHEHIDENVIN